MTPSNYYQRSIKKLAEKKVQRISPLAVKGTFPPRIVRNPKRNRAVKASGIRGNRF